MSWQSFIYNIQRNIAKSPLMVKIFLKIYNQSLCIIKYHISEGQNAEENGEEWLGQMLGEKAKVFIDVGANIGSWSEKFLKFASSDVKGLLFEPSDYAFSQLQNKFEKSTNLHLLKCAVAEREGNMTFFEEPQAGYMSSLIEGFSRPNAIKKTVPITTIDKELDNFKIDYVDLLKIDAEGYDFLVLKGAENSIKSHKIGVIQFEYCKGWALVGSSLILALKFFKSFDYEVFLLKSDGLYTFNYDLYGELFCYANFVAISPEKKSIFQDYYRGLI